MLTTVNDQTRPGYLFGQACREAVDTAANENEFWCQIAKAHVRFGVQSPASLVRNVALQHFRETQREIAR